MMIFVWLVSLYRRLVFLFKFPDPKNLAYIPENSKCPVCGAADGWLRCVRIEKPKAPPQFSKIRCQHTCAICGARWFEDPVLKSSTPENILPSIARDDNERREDSAGFSLIENNDA